jgi:hypothetical protein
MCTGVRVLKQTALAASARKGARVADDSGKKQAEDLELTPDKAEDVKGGVLPAEPGSGGTRHTAVKHHTHHKKGGPGPLQKLPHE